MHVYYIDLLRINTDVITIHHWTDFYAPTNLTISGPSKVIEGKRFYLDCKVKAFPQAEIT